MLTVVYYTDISFMDFSHNLVLYLDYFFKTTDSGQRP